MARKPHNRRTRYPAPEGRSRMEPKFVTALRAGRVEHTPEAEGVLLSITEDTLTITLDDGETLSFSREEVISWLKAA